MRRKTPSQAEKILDAAAGLFASHRFHEARMEDIAGEAGVAKGTIYRYFTDKDELYLTLLHQASEGWLTRLCGFLAEPGTPRQRLVRVVDGAITHFDENPHLFDLIQHAEAMQRPGQEFPWQKTRDHTQAQIKALFLEGGYGGDDSDLAVLMLLGGLRSVIRFGPLPRPPGLAERIVAGFLEGHARSGRGV